MRKKGPKMIKMTPALAPDSSTLLSEQAVIMMEDLLASNCRFKAATLRRLRVCLSSIGRNADLEHRWCELAVASGWDGGLTHVRAFLVEHQAMGVYLYGELAASSRAAARFSAREVLAQLDDEMDPILAKAAAELAFPT